jgi:hypothetical protein
MMNNGTPVPQVGRSSFWAWLTGGWSGAGQR